MKKIQIGSPPIYLAVTVFVIVSFVLYFSPSSKITVETEVANPILKMDLKTRMDLAMEQEIQKTMDPELGYVPREALWEAWEIMRRKQHERSKRRNKAAISGITWKERGPKNVGGRTRALLFDLHDPSGKTVFAGSVGGGVWKTTNIFATQPNWTAVNDLMENLAITSIAQDPTDHDTIYVGTGEGFYNADAIRGEGIFRSLDGGNTWTQLSSTKNSAFQYVQKIVVASNGDVFAATRTGGIQRSTNAGTSWTPVLSTGTSPSSSTTRASDIEIAADGDIFASFGIFNSDGIYKSSTGGGAGSWSKIYNSASDEERIEIACAPSNADYLYALVQDGGTNGIKKIMKSVNGGTNWTSVTSASWKDRCTGTSTSDFSRGQAWYDLLLAVSPIDEKVVTVGGVDLFHSTTEGGAWTQIGSWVGCGGFNDIHADHHIMHYLPGSGDIAVFGNDGGVYLSTDMTTDRTTSFKSYNYNVTQFYACAIHPFRNENYFLAGAQDNGTQQYSAAGIGSTNEVTGGDGAYCHINQLKPDTQITAYTYNNIQVSINGFSTYSSSPNSSIGNFINASDYDDVNHILYSASNANDIYRWSNLGNSFSKTTLTTSLMNGFQASAITVSPNTPTTVYVGTEGGRLIKITNANGGSASYSNITGSSFSGVNISSIAVQDGDENHLLVTFSNYGASVVHVWESEDGGSTWKDVDNGLPNMPVRWALFSPVNSDAALVATELGVWTCDDLNATTIDWDPSNDGLANVRVDMLQFRKRDSTIIAATHGRGLYSTSSFAKGEALFGAEKTVVYEGDLVKFWDNSLHATSWAWDLDGDGIIDSNEENPSFAYGEGGLYTVKLQINGNANLTYIRTNYIHVIPKLGTPYYKEDGGNMEVNAWHFSSTLISGSYNIWERGAPSNYFGTSHYNGSNAWVTDLDADVTKPSSKYECALLTPSFNMSATGTYRIGFWKSMESYYSSTPYAMQVQYSTDQGDTWTRLGDETTGYHWYNKGLSTCGMACINSSVSADRTGWLGTYTKDSTSFDVSSLAGNDDVRFRIYFVVDWGWNSNGYVAGALIDDFSLTGPVNKELNGSGIETTITSKTVNLGPDDSVSLYSNEGKIIATIWNDDLTHDFGETEVAIDSAGIGAKNFSTSTWYKRQIFRKTLKITPSTNKTSANVRIAMYFTKDELDAWKAATGWDAKHIQLFKTTDAIQSSTFTDGVYPSNTIIDSTYLGDGLCVLSTFSNGFSGVGAGGGQFGTNGPLPVTWLHFDAIQTNLGSMLDWSTGSELNNERFDVYRKRANLPFEKIGTVQGQGNTNNVSKYKFLDEQALLYPGDILCYKLHQVDFDGKQESSKMSCVETPLHLSIQVDPNPALDFLQIKVDPWKVGLYTVDMVDLSGKVVYAQKDLEDAHRIDVKNLKSGVYFVVIRSEGVAIQRKKVVKL